MPNPAQQAVHVSAPAFEHSQKVTRHLQGCIEQAGGWLSFKDWMAEVLYAPGLGYYAAGSHKLALRNSHDERIPGGDFVTAPELSPAFGHTIAHQISQVMRRENLHQILEFGAGSGQLALDITTYLRQSGLDVDYSILEVSEDFRDRQQALLAQSGNVQWLEAIPESFEGIIVANEVLDAMPVHLVKWSDDGASVLERGVILDHGEFAWLDRHADPSLARILASRMPALPGYLTELNLQAQAWTHTLASHLKRGLILLIDYGFSASEFYHPQRCHGTLMCHIQHRAHDNPFFAPGLQDITAHVDFSAIAASAHEAGLDVLGFTSQARFLLNAGLHEIVLRDPNLQKGPAVRAIEKLLSEAEMGELFKVMALGQNIHPDLDSFRRGNRLHQL